MPDKRVELKAVIAQFFEVKPEDVAPDFLLSGKRLASSLARFNLEAALKRKLGIDASAVHTSRTFGELESNLFPELSDRYSTKESVIGQNLSTISSVRLTKDSSYFKCGVDIEEVSNFPLADDYWENPFYADNFTASEIAYCQMQFNPRMHFAARWCAKEAIKKCLPNLLGVSPKCLEIRKEKDGSVFAIYHSDSESLELKISLSISHTENQAIAMVIAIP